VDGRRAAAEALARRERLARARRALGVVKGATGVTRGDAGSDACGVSMDDVVDPLDAYMAREVVPEVARAEAARRTAEAEARAARAMEIARARAAGERVKMREDMLELERAEAVEAAKEVPDEVIEIPASRLKLVIGAGGTNVKELTKKSGARIQVMKTDEDLNKGFSGTDFAAVNAVARAATQRMLNAITANVAASADAESDDDSTDGSGADSDDDVLNPREKTSSNATTRENAKPVAMTKIMLYGSAESRETVKRLIDDLFRRAREEKRQRRVDERERQRDKRARERRVYHLRHAADYERLELPLGASKDDVKSAFRRLAVRWHPDKHPEGPARIAAAERFANIQASYNNLMTTDEEQGMMQSIAHTSVASAAAKRPRPAVARDVDLGARAEFEIALKARAAAAEAAAARAVYKNL